MSFSLFFAVWCSIMALAYFYVGMRIIRAANLRSSKKALAWIVVAAFLIMPQVPFFMTINHYETAWLDASFWPGYLSLGLFSLILAFVLIRDLVFLLKRVATALLRAAHRFHNPRPASHARTNLERRRLLVHTSNMGILGVATVLTGYGVYEARTEARVERVSLPLPHLPKEFEGFRIVQFTDLHVGSTIKRGFVERVAGHIDSLKPDLIAFTGDLVDGSVHHLRDDVAPLRDLHAPHGKFFVTGNHEYYSGAEQWVEEADRLGFHVLLNKHQSITRAGRAIVLAGVTDFSGGAFIGSHGSDPALAIAAAPTGLVKILLAHQPKSLFQASLAGYDLQISGHTHGGQFFPWDNLARLNQPYIKGLHKHDGMWVYVSRGTGYWGPPIRLGIPPEITVITLTVAA